MRLPRLRTSLLWLMTAIALIAVLLAWDLGHLERAPGMPTPSSRCCDSPGSEIRSRRPGRHGGLSGVSSHPVVLIKNPWVSSQPSNVMPNCPVSERYAPRRGRGRGSSPPGLSSRDRPPTWIGWRTTCGSRPRWHGDRAALPRGGDRQELSLLLRSVVGMRRPWKYRIKMSWPSAASALRRPGQLSEEVTG